MKIKLSRSDWKLIGQKTGWIKKAQLIADFSEFSLGPTPVGEKCVQVGQTDSEVLNKIEVRAFINQLRRLFPNRENPDVYFFIDKNFHEAGTYYEAGIKYNEDSEEALAFAKEVENNLPELWDAEALEELKKHNYFERQSNEQLQEKTPDNTLKDEEINRGDIK